MKGCYYIKLNIAPFPCAAELPKVEMLALTGNAIEGVVLTAVEVIPKSAMQQSVWSKYKKDVKYQWLKSNSLNLMHGLSNDLVITNTFFFLNIQGKYYTIQRDALTCTH